MYILNIIQSGSLMHRCDCKNSFLQSQESGDRDQESVKTKTYGADLFLNYSFPDFLQVHLIRPLPAGSYESAAFSLPSIRA